MSKQDDQADAAGDGDGDTAHQGKGVATLHERLLANMEEWTPSNEQALQGQLLMEEASRELVRLRAALIDIDAKACKMRIWGGMGWHWHSYHAKGIHELSRQTLDGNGTAVSEKQEASKVDDVDAGLGQVQTNSGVTPR